MVEVRAGVDPRLYDVHHRAFNLPFSTFLTLRLEREGMAVWSGVFCADRLHRPFKRWSPVQTVSRVISDHLRPYEEPVRSGCSFVTEVADALAGPLQARSAELLRRIDCRGNSIDDIRAAMAEHSKLEHPECLGSRLAEFSRVKVCDLINLDPAEFRIYSVHGLPTERQDFYGCSGPMMYRIVSREGQAHRLLFEFKPHYTGYRTITEEMSARAFSAHLRSSLRREGWKLASVAEVLRHWDARIREEFVGDSGADLAKGFSTWTPANPKRNVHFILGKESAAGMAVPIVCSRFGLLSNVRAVNESIYLSCVEEMNSRSDPVEVAIACHTATLARVMVEKIATGAVEFVGLGAEVRTISAYYGAPLRCSTHAGFTQKEAEEIQAEFTKRAGRLPHCVDLDRSLIYVR